MFVNNTMGLGLSLPQADSVHTNQADIDWQPSGTEGFWLKPLFENDESRLKTWLMKIDQGAYSPEHCHEEIEQIYVLEGSFYDRDHTYVAGDMIVRATRALHEAGSETGAVALVMYAPAKKSSFHV